MYRWVVESLRNWVHLASVSVARASTDLFISKSVYGPDAVTSGASSDIRSATNTARNMVKVSVLDLEGKDDDEPQLS